MVFLEAGGGRDTTTAWEVDSGRGKRQLRGFWGKGNASPWEGGGCDEKKKGGKGTAEGRLGQPENASLRKEKGEKNVRASGGRFGWEKFVKKKGKEGERKLLAGGKKEGKGNPCVGGFNSKKRKKGGNGGQATERRSKERE